MGIVNRRNALIGWAVLKLGKRAAKRKARQAVPGPETRRKGVAAVAAVLAGFGALAYWRRRPSDAGGD